ncbi:MAG: hypothetical protein ACREJO_15615 [Phycisphaerales bacterium]
MLADVVGDPIQADWCMALLLADILVQTEEFEDALVTRRLDPRAGPDREIFLVAHPQGAGHILVIADGGLPPKEYLDFDTLAVGSAAFDRGLSRWDRLRNRRPLRDRMGVSPKVRMDTVIAGLTPGDFNRRSLAQSNIVFVHRPPIIRTSCPNPAWSVVNSGGAAGSATVGCLVRNSSGRKGVTTARHLIGTGAVVGTYVDVNGNRGKVVEEDVITDSIFVEVSAIAPPAAATGLNWCLSGTAPRPYAPATFHGATSGTQTTAMSAADPGLLTYSPYRQARIYTAPVTNPGDSGAALIEDSSDMIIGFAHERTAPGAYVEWSSWIWADSVVQALRLKPY